MTTGGLAVDPAMRVRRQGPVSGSLHPVPVAVLPGLYAAGADVGAVSHHGYFGGLPTALVTGRIAGSNAATAALASRHPGASASTDPATTRGEGR
jgi:succinate dehydrogenase/fumarate reductase flavoprotein subunit